jgi:hypothetical protein
MLSIQGIEDFSITHAAKLDDAAIVAYVTEGQAELCEFSGRGLHPEILKFMPMVFQPELKRELRQFACHTGVIAAVQRWRQALDSIQLGRKFGSYVPISAHRLDGPILT